MTDANLTCWARTMGYDPEHDYTETQVVPVPGELPPGYLSPHFRADEFRCRCCGELHPPPPELLAILEDTRAHFGGKAITINSGYRCPAHNAAVKGATHSRHMAGDAADIVVGGAAPPLVYAYLDKRVGDKGGVGNYNTFTHVDVRGHRVRW